MRCKACDAYVDSLAEYCEDCLEQEALAYSEVYMEQFVYIKPQQELDLED